MKNIIALGSCIGIKLLKNEQFFKCQSTCILIASQTKQKTKKRPKKKIYSCLVFIYLSFVLELNYFVILKLEAASLIPEFLSFLRSSFNLVHIC